MNTKKIESNKKMTLSKKVRSKPTDQKLSDLKLKDRRMFKKKIASKNSKTKKITGSQNKAGPSVKRTSKDPYVSTKVGVKNKVAFDITSISSHLSCIGLDTQHDDFDVLDLYASHIIELINEGVYVFANLTKHERYILFRYFYRTNPVLGRIIDIHTEIPTSKFRLQAPKNCPEILKDFIVQFYEKILERINFNEFLRDLVLHYWIYGEAYGFIDDYFGDANRLLQKIQSLNENLYTYKDEDAKFLEKVEEDYKVDPDQVDLVTRIKYLETKFMGFFQKEYTGPDSVKVIKFYDIEEYYHNEDIKFEAIRYTLSDGLNDLISGKVTPDELVEMGYSKGFVELLNNSENKNKGSVLIENNTESGEPFIMVFKRYEGTAIMQRIFESCLAWENAKRALKVKIGQIGKLGRIVTSEGLSEGQTDNLRMEVDQMIDDPNYAIVANYNIDWNEVNSFLKDELDQLVESTADLTGEISLGAGMPESLISGDSQYSGDNIKLDILNNQYFAFKITIQNLLEDKFLKPIALRKGLISIDSWGTPTLLYPKLTGSRVSLRSEEYFDLLFDLYQKNSLPISIIYDLLNLDADDVTRAIQEDLFTLKDATFNDLMRDIYGQLSDSIVSNTDLTNKIIDGLGLPRKEESDEDDEDDEPKKFKRW